MHDPDLDNLVNIHEIKHWMDPSLIGFGWGLYQEKDEAIAIDVDIDTGGKMWAIGNYCCDFVQSKYLVTWNARLICN